jgi:transposase
MSIDNDTRGYIRYLHFNQHDNISHISAKTGVSRKTIKRILDGKLPRENRSQSSKLDPFKPQIQTILSEKPLMPTILILEKIRAQGYRGGRTIVYDYVLQQRTSQRPAYIPLETLPGEQAQVDWGYCDTISCGQHRRKLYVFCMSLSYSRYFFLEFTVSMDMDTFLACHIHGFHFFEGVPKTILYDNLKSVVSHRVGKEVTFNARHFDFAAFYGFSPRLCNIGKAHEKGRVERMIQYIKGNFLNRGPFESFDQIRADSKIWLKQVANKRLHSVTRKIPQEAFDQQEQPHLLQLPPTAYDYCKPYPLPVSKQCLLQFQTNKYSVPSEYAYKTVTVKASTAEIHISYDHQTIATHRRCYDKYQLIKNPDHYKRLLEKKRQAESTVMIGKFEKLCPESKAYLSGLLNHQKNVHYHVAKILELAALFGKTVVSAAIVKALQHQAFPWEYIKNIVLETHGANYQVPISLQNKEIMALDIEPPDLSKYDEQDDN